MARASQPLNGLCTWFEFHNQRSQHWRVPHPSCMGQLPTLSHFSILGFQHSLHKGCINCWAPLFLSQERKKRKNNARTSYQYECEPVTQMRNTTFLTHIVKYQHTHAPITPNFPSVKLLVNMMRSRCWPTTFHTITTGDADGWCYYWPVWSAPHPGNACKLLWGSLNCRIWSINSLCIKSWFKPKSNFNGTRKFTFEMKFNTQTVQNI